MEISQGIVVVLVVVAAMVVWVSIKRPRVGVALSLLAFIPAPLFPSPGVEWFFYGFAGFTLLVLLGWLLRLAFRIEPFRPFPEDDKIGFSLKLWLVLSALGLPLSLVFNQGTLNERLYFYAKGMAPFVYLLIFFVVRSLPFGLQETKRILDYLLMIAIAFTILTFAIYGATHARVISFYVPLAFPFIVLGADVTFIRMLMACSRRALSLWALVTGTLTIAVLLNFTKAQVIVLICSLGMMIFLVSRHREYRRAVRRSFMLVLFFVILGGCAAMFSSGESQAGFSDLVNTRLHDDSSEEARVAELREAFGQFVDSPIVGKGIGFQLERDVLGESLTSGYVHNQTAYTAMTMGCAGLLLFGLLVGNWAWLLLQFRQVPTDRVATLATLHGCVFSLIAYAQMFATFRTIQHNLLLGVLLALIVRLTPQQSPVSVRTVPTVGGSSIAKVA